ncbi:MAG: histidinol-phosphatase HisJ family protein [Ruminococcaceae bacterium]|nr:histidinol-phosphatase HisJ family protein [Oscillospiraceae bacterium]
MFDFHIHSTVSYDGHGTPEQMARAAVAAGLQEICFADHVDDDPLAGIVPEHRFTPESYGAAYDGLEVPGVLIRRGMEFGMLPNNRAGFEECLRWREFDFVLGSVHYADGMDVYERPYWEGKTQFEGERRYLEDVLECVRVHDGFDVLGHLTYISKARHNPTHRPVPLKDHREVVAEILKVLIAKGKGIEVNTSGVFRSGDLLPTEEYLRLYKDLGGRIITVGSDAHTPDRVGEYAGRALGLLKDVFGYVCTFEGRKPIFHML